MSVRKKVNKSTAVSNILGFGDALTSPGGDITFPGEMRHMLWEMCISQGDDTSPVVDEHISRVWAPRLPREMRHLNREMWVHLQNLGYVTPLKHFIQIKN